MKKVVLIIAFVFVLLSVSQVSSASGYNSAQSNIANRIHVDVFYDVGNLLLLHDFSAGVEFFKEVKKAEPRETSRIPGKGLNAVNVKLAKKIQVNVLISVSLLKEVKKAEPKEVAKEIFLVIKGIPGN